MSLNQGTNNTHIGATLLDARSQMNSIQLCLNQINGLIFSEDKYELNVLVLY